MAEIGQSIELRLSEKLKDREYRRRYFVAEASTKIAEQIISLRKKRGLSQKEVAKLVETGQPAISRAEQADYQNWSLRTLRGIADALDARLRVIIEPAEDVLSEYEKPIAPKEDDTSKRPREVLAEAPLASAPRPPRWDDGQLVHDSGHRQPAPQNDSSVQA